MKKETRQNFMDRLDFFQDALYAHIANNSLTDDIVYNLLCELANLEIVLSPEMTEKMYDRFYEVEDLLYNYAQNKEDPRFRRPAKTYGRCYK